MFHALPGGLVIQIKSLQWGIPDCTISNCVALNLGAGYACSVLYILQGQNIKDFDCFLNSFPHEFIFGLVQTDFQYFLS